MSELKVLKRYLQAPRDVLLWKLDGLSERQIRRPMTGTGTNLLGLVKHCAGVEKGYFDDCFGRTFGEPMGRTGCRGGRRNGRKSPFARSSSLSATTWTARQSGRHRPETDRRPGGAASRSLEPADVNARP